MKKSVFAFLFGWFVCSLLSAQLVDNGQQNAQQLFDWMREAKGDSVYDQCAPSVQNMITPQTFDGVWKSLTAQFGALVSQGEWHSDVVSGSSVYYCNVKFEKYLLRFNVVFDKEGKVTSLNFAPAPPEVAVSKKTMDVSKVAEQDIVVTTGQYKLPGTLAMPKVAKGDVPVVIIVHGSGASDRNESVGELKPFQELAWGLAEQGIATIRYDKRTLVYPGALWAEAGQHTFDTESVDDAISAVQLAKTLPGIDSTKVYVLGHSLGGLLVPRIAQRLNDTEVLAGIISLAGATRKLQAMIEEQLTYLASIAGNEVDAKAEAAKIMESQPQSYRDFEAGYDPIAVAKTLKLPILILQGERDYQVTMEDFGNWRMGLMRSPNARFKSYPKLNHLLQEGKGKSTPMEYAVYSPVPVYLITDIAAFVNGTFE